MRDCTECTGRTGSRALHKTRASLPRMFGTAGMLTRPAGCSETRQHGGLGYHQLSQGSSTHSLTHKGHAG
jgi:hypothetical protein